MDEYYILKECDMYEISKNGIVRNRNTKKILKHRVDPDGYIRVGLNINRKSSHRLLHRLLAYNFIQNPDNLYSVDHINRIRDDNRLVNLRWASMIDQNKNKNRKPNVGGIKVSKYKDGEFIETFDNYKLAAKSLNIHKDTFGRFINKSYEFYGYTWVKLLDNLKSENFKKIIINNKETGYMISEKGTIINKSGCINKGRVAPSGYITCSINGKQCRVHRLVAIAFLPNFFGKTFVNHKDGNKSNCNIYNLEWVSRSENILHSTRVLKKGVVEVNQFDLNGNFIRTFDSVTLAAENVGSCTASISSACKGTRKSVAGFLWYYV
jgi:hypothetical protein